MASVAGVGGAGGGEVSAARDKAPAGGRGGGAPARLEFS